MLAKQRDENNEVANAVQKKISSLKRDCRSTVADANEAAEDKVLAAKHDRDVAVADAKRVVIAERHYCQERRDSTITKVNEKLFFLGVALGLDLGTSVLAVKDDTRRAILLTKNLF